MRENVNRGKENMGLEKQVRPNLLFLFLETCRLLRG